MNPRVKKFILLLLAAALLFGSGRVERSLNHDRAALGLTVAEPLQNAPPMLAFTTVALGGFRGLISNFLWIRANDLQQEDKFFEAAQLAGWITDLEPHFSQVWVYQAWNMAFNISVKFKENSPGDYTDRWRWVRNGISLLRDNGLRYNPDDILIHRELAWFFQFKMGANLDDANLYYKKEWAREMTPFFGPLGTNVVDLLAPGNTNAAILRERYKLDPAIIEKVNEQYGPLDWRLPEPHALYWATIGLDQAQRHPDKVKADDLITLRRVVYQSMQQEFQHGRMISNPYIQDIEVAPNLDIVSKVNDAYVKIMLEDTQYSNSIARAGYKNFLSDAVYFLYANNRQDEARKWFKYLGERYPDRALLNDPNSFQKNLTLEDYVFGRLNEDMGETSLVRVTSAIEGMLAQAYLDLSIGEDERSAGYQLLAQKAYKRYQDKMGIEQPRVTLPSMDDLKKDVLRTLLDPSPQNQIPYAARAVVRSRLGLGPETTNNVPFAIPTNTVAPVTTPNPATKTNR